MTIRPLNRSDYNQWLPLWQENCLHQISEEVTLETWRRLCHPKEPVHGLGIFDEDENLLGFLHFILHHTTGFVEPACYMQDLFISETARRQGLARRLVWELQGLGKGLNWARIYWFADNNNEATQNLYKNLGIRMDFTLFMLQTNT